MEESRSRWTRIYAGVALTTFGTLLLELALTRIFSVVFYYHFAFLAISIALFGLGAGGVFSYVVAAWRGNLFAKLGWLAMLHSLLVAASLVFLLTRHADPGGLTLAAVYFAAALPFFVTGAIVSLVIADSMERIHRVYFFDLAGAAAGCLALIPLLDQWGGPNTVLAVSALSAISAAVWFNLAGRRAAAGAAAVLALGAGAFIQYNAQHRVIDVRYAKGRKLAEERFVQWNSFSRIALAREQETGEPNIVIDADAATGIPRFDLDRLTAEERRGLLSQGPGLVYNIRPRAKTLVIGSGGGWDIARAIASGSRDVTGVEINPIIADTIMRRRFADLSRGLYLRPEVKIVIEDGRSYVRRSQEKYQVLQATLVDTWASTAAGAFALSENNLYTTDAFHDYLLRLTDDGVLSFTRWGFQPPRESLRLLSLAMEALTRLGEGQPGRHIIVVRENSGNLNQWGALDTVLVARKPFTPEALARARAAILEHRLEATWLPGDAPVNEFGKLLNSSDPVQFQRDYRFDISPVGDNRPFFFYTVQPRDLWEFVRHASRLTADYNVNRAVPMLLGSLAVSLLAVALILALPLLLLGSRLPRGRKALGSLWYFALIGVGYILIQVALVQRFVLFLGRPAYALTVIIFSMLVSSGLGSYFSRKLVAGSDRRLERVLWLVALCVSVLALAAPGLLAAGAGWPLGMKFLSSVLLIAPAGFLMGMPFPTGLKRLEERHPLAVRWAWSLNAAASVLGSVAAIVLAIYLGLRETMLVGAAVYLCAMVTVRRTRAGAPESGA